MTERKLDSIDAAIADIEVGKLVIVVDDEDRENEGDFICAAEKVTPEIVNFMVTEGRGLICVPMDGEYCERLGLNLMTPYNTESHETAFTIPVDAIGEGVTTGISAYDRYVTIKKLSDPETRSEHLARPGHVFPLKARKGGVLRRAGHTEAAVDLARAAGFNPAGAIVEIMNPDGTMARLPELFKVADQHGLKVISIKDLIAWRLAKESLVEKGEAVHLPTDFGDFKLIAFREKSSGLEHAALVKGEWGEDEAVMVRVHSSCLTGDIFGSRRCDCQDQLHLAMQMVNKEGKGIVLYMNQEGRGIGLLNKMKAYKLQEQGFDTVDANTHLGFKPDERSYGVGAQILRSLGVRRLCLLTNNPVKRAGLEGYGLEVVKNIPVEIEPNEHNVFYLKTKRDRMGHALNKCACHEE